MGPTFLIFTLIFICITLIILIVIFLARKITLSDKNRKRLESMKKTLFFNSFIRYTFLSANKLFMAVMMGLKNFNEIPTGSNTFAIALLIIIVSLPIIYAKIMHKNALTLETDKQMEKFKTIYQDRIVAADKKIWLYPLMFFLRRIVFIMATVFVFSRPEIQMIIH